MIFALCVVAEGITSVLSIPGVTMVSDTALCDRATQRFVACGVSSIYIFRILAVTI